MKHTINAIKPVNKEAGKRAKAHLNRLTKPPGSLGRLEELAVKLAEITGHPFPETAPPASIVFAADHGIAEEGVSAYPQKVTEQMVYNFLNGGAAINVLAKQAGALFKLVDVGVAADLEGTGLIDKKIRYGTGNFLKEKAMTPAEAELAILTGIEQAEEAINQGACSLILGEMGIGNTTSASAILAVLRGSNSDQIVGCGTGISPEKRLLKEKVIRQALAARKPGRDHVVDILSSVGGLEIAGMTGAVLGAASKQTPVIIDGFICTISALLAVKLSPSVKEYLIFSHLSQEPGHKVALEMLGEAPLLDLNLRLGEGTGAALAYPLLESAVRILKDMAVFTDEGVPALQNSEKA
ncbi:nicotinate-nucleotide--dimethylbenzimidazole phosphoribosyltransferase [Salipaludibacillus sp. CUR1]|uniref:nicotinate-nucleotide--dimethylbenzimidazole phosphoribosyltransferase n=1 Tax=Salipaludibacillus sp. CUR1 TaxID=2820003 RepID=UPI001E3A2E2D|nr:nicotinate-nucleotide--dimethylbenzimidazole phosphoribosyltransferase [Salipaludibacillus sp. CUR1]MCE7791603.1 nicotinate-nucleotide--dimethylbenzimidazole phosphoribosyltransferase [Salipaludibacillus sp. CUR1]